MDKRGVVEPWLEKTTINQNIPMESWFYLQMILNFDNLECFFISFFAAEQGNYIADFPCKDIMAVIIAELSDNLVPILILMIVSPKSKDHYTCYMPGST